VSDHPNGRWGGRDDSLGEKRKNSLTSATYHHKKLGYYKPYKPSIPFVGILHLKVSIYYRKVHKTKRNLNHPSKNASKTRKTKESIFLLL